ncbi:IclR family transcriptional regulator [Acuticoccus sediminis]|uniref:IclR family transcriptional regulator n=1 Tax=Acuticoccus sediminis TaxID=2184697 RepID=UPI001390C946|nr:IclR family transcriptional regulator C-terminal domain-containing protein [Acuticoccus sediminis]
MAGPDYQLKTLTRGLQVLGTIERADQPLTLTEIAEAMDEPAPVVFRVLRTLEAGGHLRRNGKRYTAVSSGDGLTSARWLISALGQLSAAGTEGIAAATISAAIDADAEATQSLLALMRDGGLADEKGERWVLSPRLLKLARPLIADRTITGLRGLMERVRAHTGESVGLFVRSGTQQVLVEMLGSPQPIRYELEVGSTFPVHRGAGGRAALMPLEPEETHRLLTELDLGEDALEAVMAAVALSREAGYASSLSERVEGAGAVACPVLDHKGEPVAVINIMYPAFRLQDTQVRAFGEYLRGETTSPL